jgi:hypothetical protein
MTPTMKWLLLAAGALFGLYGLDQLYQGWIEEPRQAYTATIDKLEGDLQKDGQVRFASQKAAKRLEEYQYRALPSDPVIAKSLYQQWLLEMVDRYQLASASVDASQPTPIEIKSRTKRGKRVRIGHRIDYSLRGQTTLAKLTAFLDAFRRASHLQKIRSVSLNPLGNDGRLDVNLSIQVLCLDDAASADSLSNWILTEEASSELPLGNALVQRNPFAKGFAKALRAMELKAITVNRKGDTQAWFAADARGRIEKVTAGKMIPNALHEIQVVQIETDRVLIRLNDSEHWIRLGESIGQVVQPESEKEETLRSSDPDSDSVTEDTQGT